MNNQLLLKVIKFNNKTCPEIRYDNPLLDRRIAREVSKSFVKILNITSKNANNNQTLRLCVLRNIRKLCQTDPEGHVHTDDNFLEMLCELYSNYLNTHNKKLTSCERKLNTFIRRKLHELNIENKRTLNPEVIQALLNVKHGVLSLRILCQDILNWNENDHKYKNIVQSLWENIEVNSSTVGVDTINDLTLKMRGGIEKKILQITYEMLSDHNINVTNFIELKEDVQNLINRCSESDECFYTCCYILNTILKLTKFDETLLQFIQLFIKSVEKKCGEDTFSALYPAHLQSAVLVLSIDITYISEKSSKFVVEKAMNLLNTVKSHSEDEFILLLSHYPYWFDVYHKLYQDSE